MKDQSGGRARMMDDLAGVAGGAFSVLTGIRAEIEAIAKAQAEAIIRRLDLVRREELDAAKQSKPVPKSGGKSSSGA